MRWKGYFAIEILSGIVTHLSPNVPYPPGFLTFHLMVKEETVQICALNATGFLNLHQ